MKFKDQSRANAQIYMKTRKEKNNGAREGSTKFRESYNGGNLISRARVSGLD